MTNVSLQQALEKYHALYNNGAYNAIRAKIIADLFGKEARIDLNSQDTQVTDLMNNLIDACLECCGSEQHIGAHIWLAKSAVWAKLEIETIDLIHAYLAKFQSTIAGDFQATAKALTYVYLAKSSLEKAIAHASCVHSTQGRTAYHLLASADFLRWSAELLLCHHDDESYVREKVKSGINRLDSALKEYPAISPVKHL